MMPPVPVEVSAPEFGIPDAVLSRIVAGVRSVIGQSVTAEEVERRREAEGADLACLCCGSLTCPFAENNVA